MYNYIRYSSKVVLRGKWSLDLTKYAKAKDEQIKTVRKKVAMAIYSGVVQRTPVDTGRARGNWVIGIGEDIQTATERTGDCSGQEIPKLNSANGDETIYISNNLPYIAKLEYGGYSKKSDSGKTINGYSKQAPQGMVGVTMARIKDKVEQIVKESK